MMQPTRFLSDIVARVNEKLHVTPSLGGDDVIAKRIVDRAINEVLAEIVVEDNRSAA